MEYTNEEQMAIFSKEREKNPEIFKMVQDFVAKKEIILYKKGSKFIEIPFNEISSMIEFKKLSQYAWCVNIRLNNGEPRLVIEIVDYKEIEYIKKHMPVINYIPEALFLEDYGKKWKEVK